MLVGQTKRYLSRTLAVGSDYHSSGRLEINPKSQIYFHHQRVFPQEQISSPTANPLFQSFSTRSSVAFSVYISIVYRHDLETAVAFPFSSPAFRSPSINMGILSFVTGVIAPLFIIISPITSYADQTYSMHRSKSSAGFSLDIPLIMLVASMLR